jgi:hypothetical protein
MADAPVALLTGILAYPLAFLGGIFIALALPGLLASLDHEPPPPLTALALFCVAAAIADVALKFRRQAPGRTYRRRGGLRTPTDGGQRWHSYGSYWWQLVLVAAFTLAVYAVDSLVFDARVALDVGSARRHVASRSLDQLRDGMRQTYVHEALHDQTRMRVVVLRAVCVFLSAATAIAVTSWWSHAERALVHQPID